MSDTALEFSDLKIVNEQVYLGKMQLFALLRSLETLCNLKSEIGNEKRFADSPLRFGQSAFLAFQDKQINALTLKERYLKVDIKGFGVFGPNGALPLHISEQIYEKKLHQKDQTFNDFVDIFQNRLIALFYKSWRNAQDVVSLDGEDSWRFSRFIASMVGVADQQELMADISAYSKFYFSNLLLNVNRPKENLELILSYYFNIPVKVIENIGQWIDASAFSTPLSNPKKLTLGDGVMIGDKIFDATQKIRIEIGPISPQKYVSFLSGEPAANKLIAWVDHYLKHQFEWDAEFIIDKDQIAQQSLGSGVALGFTSWNGQPKINPRVIIQY